MEAAERRRNYCGREDERGCRGQGGGPIEGGGKGV